MIVISIGKPLGKEKRSHALREGSERCLAPPDHGGGGGTLSQRGHRCVGPCRHHERCRADERRLLSALSIQDRARPRKPGVGSRRSVAAPAGRLCCRRPGGGSYGLSVGRAPRQSKKWLRLRRALAGTRASAA